MNHSDKTILTLLFFLCSVFIANAQQPFKGSFLTTFAFNTQENMPPLLWNVDGDKIAIEIQDTMKRKGVTRRILFNAADSTWLMCMEFNDVKQATRMRTKNMAGKEKKLNTKNLKTISRKNKIQNYYADKMAYQTKNGADTMLITEEHNFDFPKHYELLCHCGLVNISLRKGNWYGLKNKKGMVVYAKSTDKKTGNTYAVTVSEIKPGQVNPALFSTTGFKITDIPEGQSCGPMTKE